MDWLQRWCVYGIFFGLCGCRYLRTSGSRGLQEAFGILPPPSLRRSIQCVAVKRQDRSFHGTCDLSVFPTSSSGPEYEKARPRHFSVSLDHWWILPDSAPRRYNLGIAEGCLYSYYALDEKGDQNFGLSYVTDHGGWMLDRKQPACGAWLSTPESKGGSQACLSGSWWRLTGIHLLIPASRRWYEAWQWGAGGTWASDAPVSKDSAPAFLHSHPLLGNQLWHRSMMAFSSESTVLFCKFSHYT